MTIDLPVTLAVAERIARLSGAILREALYDPKHVDYKTATDIVTDTDHTVERFIVDELRHNFPDFGIVGEEGTRHGDTAAEYSWHVDPLDGTTNFERGIAHFAVSLGLANAEGQPVVGVAYDPMRDECFTAIKQGGASLNGTPIQVSRVTDLSRSIVSMGFPKDRWTNPDNNVKEVTNVMLRAQSVAKFGSSALDLCYVAVGRFDGMWQPRLFSWDVMAGLLCVTEAGGRVSDYQGLSQKLYTGQQVVASNGLIHAQLLATLAIK